MPGHLTQRSAALAGLTCCLLAPHLRAADPDEAEFFEKKVRPIFATQCQSCHGADKQSAGLRLDYRGGPLAGGDSGPAIVSGDPDRSRLLDAVRYAGDIRMPPKGKLTDEQIADLERWVRMGAPWPGGDAPPAGNAEDGIDLEARARHWSFQPIRSAAVPDVEHSEWPLTPIDRFLIRGKEPPDDCDRRTWLRRVTFDLIGLPPAPGEIREFLADESPEAHAKVADRLLASPHLGERWGRHWLDLMRFAETSGHEFDFDMHEAWRYRDYVIRAINDDLPYDRFVVEHVAGDLLPEPRRHPTERFNESVIATGFWFLGESKHSPVDVRGDEADRVDNQIDVFSKAFLGVTVACARCHDHKFDPVTQADYYALCGFIQSSRYQRAFIDDPAPVDGLVKGILEARDRASETVYFSREKQASVSMTRPTAELYKDFSDYADWFVTGHAFGDAPTTEIEPVFSADPARPVLRYRAPGVADSGRISDRLRGVLRSPTFRIESKFILYRVAGKDATINLILDGLQHIRAPIYGGLTVNVNHGDEFRWVAMDLSMWQGHAAYVEFLDDGDGHIAIDAVTFADTNRGPELPPASLPAEVEPLTGDAAEEFRAAMAKVADLESRLPTPNRAMAIADGTPERERLHIRGSHKNLGEPVNRRYFEVFDGPDPIVETGTGRLALARRMVAEDNPLTARVIVNRLWHHHFGTGIVASPDNFGIQGKPPTHPELLDHLATKFRQDGWSLKNLHREMVLSRYYRRAPDAGTVKRLEAEAVRDAILSASGRLDRHMFGSGPMPHLTEHMIGRGRPGTSGPLDGDGRRGVYLNVRRNFLNPFFLAFDFPTPATAIGRRSVSNVPAQALTLMNNPFVLQQAERWGLRISHISELNAAGRVELMYETAFGRPPTEAETGAALSFLGGRDADPHRLAELAHVLINAKEFVFIP